MGDIELISDMETSGKLQPGLNVSLEFDASNAHLFTDDGRNLISSS